MIISKKTLPRRTFLRGVGAAVALPILDAMFLPWLSLVVPPNPPAALVTFIFLWGRIQNLGFQKLPGS